MRVHLAVEQVLPRRATDTSGRTDDQYIRITRLQLLCDGLDRDVSAARHQNSFPARDALSYDVVDGGALPRSRRSLDLLQRVCHGANGSLLRLVRLGCLCRVTPHEILRRRRRRVPVPRDIDARVQDRPEHRRRRLALVGFVGELPKSRELREKSSDVPKASNLALKALQLWLERYQRRLLISRVHIPLPPGLPDHQMQLAITLVADEKEVMHQTCLVSRGSSVVHLFQAC